YFRAEGRPTGVALSWSYEGPRMTGSFNLFRQAEAGGRARLNAEPVRGRPPFRFADETARTGETYRYWLEYVPATGFSRTYGPVVGRAGSRPAAFALAAPWPNPAREAVTFAFTLPADDPEAELEIFDLAGRRLATVSRGGRAGANVVTWSPAAAVPPGVYFCRLTAAGNSAVKKLAVVR
ncbi:MAG: T9SS type A sorting domain-containing protein, partial [Candidatus Coatesbacteria bacterium]